MRRIQAYGHELASLDEGLTAELELEGVLPPELADGSLLEDAEQVVSPAA